MSDKKRVFIVDVVLGGVLTSALKVILENPVDIATLKDDLKIVIGVPVEIKDVNESTMENLDK